MLYIITRIAGATFTKIYQESFQNPFEMYWSKESESIFLMIVLQCKVSSAIVFEVLAEELNTADVLASTYRDSLGIICV